MPDLNPDLDPGLNPEPELDSDLNPELDSDLSPGLNPEPELGSDLNPELGSDLEKRGLTARFRAYLDRAFDQAGQVGQAGLDDLTGADEGADLAHLYVELAGLRNEVRLESRQVKGALDRFGELFDAVSENQAALARETTARQQAQSEGPREALRHLLLDLLEFRDRLDQGLQVLERGRPPWLARLFEGAQHRAWREGLKEGQRMLLRRLDRLLAAQEVLPLETLGLPLDPERMRAVATGWDPKRPEGVVIEQRRPGYLWRGRPLRIPEVTVNRRNGDNGRNEEAS